MDFKYNLEKLQDAENINELLTEEQSNHIGRIVCEGYEIDEQSRMQWKDKMKDANELALQIAKEKSSPWRGAANVKFPLVTIAALQFASRAYPALVKAPDLVKYRVQGSDPDGMKAARATRISRHMSYQCLDEDEGWEEDHDRLLLTVPIIGTAFKKTYYDSVTGHNCSRLVLAKNLCVNYYTKSLDRCERKTEILELYDREIKERQLRKVFSEIKDLGPSDVPEEREEDKRQGLSQPLDDKARPRTILEQHCYWDLDGDGYKEPYVVTVDKSSQKVFRIVSRFKEVVTEQALKIKDIQGRIQSLAEGLSQPGQEVTQELLVQAQQIEMTVNALNQQIAALAQEKPKVLRIEAIEYYTKYPFIPSPDGGFYDIGMGMLLGPLNNSVNTLINQLIDAGSLQNGSVGFIGKGARIKGGKISFAPNEWKRVDVAGPTLRDAIVPLPVNAPSPVLFNLLSLLISYTERVSSVSDTMVGENPGQNTPAYNMSAMLEQGMQVFNGIFKRTYRAMRAEFRKLYDLNAVYLDNQHYYEYQDEEGVAVRVDYTADKKDLIPAADPNAFSNQEKLMKAQMLAERSAMVPGYDPLVVERRLLESMDIPNAAEVYPLVPEVNPETGEPTGGMTLKFPPQPDPELEIKKADMQRRTLEGQSRAEKDFMIASAQMAVSEAEVIKIYAEAQKIADEPQLKRIELLLDEIQHQREMLVEAAGLEDKKDERADKKAERNKKADS
jgi:chaperonin GroES